MRKLVLGTLVLIAVSAVFWLLLPAKQPAPALPEPVRQISKTTSPPLKESVVVTNIPGIGPIPSDPKEIARLKAKIKRDLDAHFAGTAFFTSREESRKADDTGEIAWIFINRHNSLEMAMEHITKSATEPFPQRILEALQHILVNGTDAQMKLTAATLLYRYAEPAGKTYLLSLLNSPNADKPPRSVVMTLAINREPESISGILSTFPRMGPHYDDVQIALGRWQEPLLAQMVRQQYANDPRNWGYALGLSQADDKAAIAPLTEALKTRSNLPSGLTIQAALTHLGAIDAATWVTIGESCFQSRSRLGDLAVIKFLDIAGPVSSIGIAKGFLGACIPLHEAYLEGMELQAQGIRENNPALANKFPKPSPYEFIKGAAQLLAQWDAKEAVPTLQQVLTTVQKGNRSDVYLNEALGLALYKLDPASWRDTLLNAGVTQYHVDRIPELAKLRPIPAEYLPKQVNLKTR